MSPTVLLIEAMTGRKLIPLSRLIIAKKSDDPLGRRLSSLATRATLRFLAIEHLFQAGKIGIGGSDDLADHPILLTLYTATPGAAKRVGGAAIFTKFGINIRQFFPEHSLQVQQKIRNNILPKASKQ